MDFELNEAQTATRSLAARILADLAPPERHKELEANGEWFDERAWHALAEAGLLGIAAPEAFGGAGLGFFEVALVLEEIGRTTAKVPYFASVVLGVLPIARFGAEAFAAAWLPPLIDGSSVATAALVPESGPVRAHGHGESARLSGAAVCVPAGLDASLLIVPALEDSASSVFVVAAGADGVTRERQDTTTGIPEALVRFDGAPALTRLGRPGEGGAILTWIQQRAAAGLAATAVGVCDASLQRTAAYTKTREQFGRPIATFQAVGQRAADAYIDTEAMRLTALQAAWRLDEGLPADAEVAIATFWAADGGARVVHAAQHLHGGMGVDRDYPLHRLFLWAKHIELTLGGATAPLLTLGERLAGDGG